MKDTYAFDSTDCQPAHRALSARTNIESDCRHRPLGTAHSELIHYIGRRANRGFEILRTTIANASDVRHRFDARSAHIDDVLVRRSAPTIPISTWTKQRLMIPTSAILQKSSEVENDALSAS